MRTLSIDIGGTGLKMLVLNEQGEPVTERTRILTPTPATPDAVLTALASMKHGHGSFDRLSCGFPGVVVEGVTLNAPNLHPSWAGVELAERLTQSFGVPARVANDADVQGYGAMQGQGVELVITLGTGVGSALFVEGVLVPNLELGHAPFTGGASFEEVLGKQALKAHGKKVWREQLTRALAIWRGLFNPTQIYLGGGHAKKVKSLPEGVSVVHNRQGLLGGIALWRT